MIGRREILEAQQASNAAPDDGTGFDLFRDLGVEPLAVAEEASACADVQEELGRPYRHAVGAALAAGLELGLRLRDLEAAKRSLADELVRVADRARAERDVHVTLIGRSVADSLRVWSEPIQVMVEPVAGELVELTVRRVDEHEAIERGDVI